MTPVLFFYVLAQGIRQQRGGHAYQLRVYQLGWKQLLTLSSNGDTLHKKLVLALVVCRWVLFHGLHLDYVVGSARLHNVNGSFLLSSKVLFGLFSVIVLPLCVLFCSAYATEESNGCPASNMVVDPALCQMPRQS